MRVLPPVDLVRVGDDYYVNDGHNRVAAARRNDVVEIDADVIELVLPGVQRSGQRQLLQTGLAGSAELRAAGTGRHSSTVVARAAYDQLDRRQLAAAAPNPVENKEGEV